MVDHMKNEPWNVPKASVPKTVCGFLFAAAICIAGVQPGRAQDAPANSLPRVDRYTVGGTGGWDYLTLRSGQSQLFITRGDRVQVFDTRTDKVSREIPGTAGVHGVALADELGLGFTSNGRSNSVSVFELGSLDVVGEIKGTGDGPDAILYDPVSKRVFTFNGRGRSATVIDAGSKAIIGSIALSGKPEFAVLDGHGSLFVNIEDRNSISRINIATSTVTAEWPISSCESPTGIAIDAVHGRLFSACQNRKMVVVDTGSGKVIADVAIGAGPDAVAFDSLRSLVLTSNGDGTLSVVRQQSPDAYSPVASVPTQKGARTMALDESTHRVYLVTTEFGATPPATVEQPRPRPVAVPGTFSVLVVDIGALH
jgi:DNA-binding beta-propeller fold protein YncE